MFKSFAAKAIVPVVLAVTGFVVISCLVLYSVMREDMVREAVKRETALAQTIVMSTRYAMLKEDRETLRNIIDNIGHQDGVEHVRIFNKKGVVMFSKERGELRHLVDKKAEGCIGCHAGSVASARLGKMEQARRFYNDRNVKVLAITAPIYNETECFNAACHFHSPSQKVLGILDIGLDEAPLQAALSTMQKRMGLFTIMILILTTGGVAAMLARSIFTPLRQLTEFTERAKHGNLDAFPEHGGEISLLADNFRRLVEELKALRELYAAKNNSLGTSGSSSGGGSDSIQGMTSNNTPEQSKDHGPSFNTAHAPELFGPGRESAHLAPDRKNP